MPGLSNSIERFRRSVKAWLKFYSRQSENFMNITNKKLRRPVYLCQQCGYQSGKWLGRCPGCGEWESLVEEMIDTRPAWPLGPNPAGTAGHGPGRR